MKFTESIFNEKGGVVVETALVFPFFLYVMFVGFELSRISELQLVRRDIARVLSLTHVCAFKQDAAANACYQEAIGQVTQFTSNRFPGTQFYIQNYAIDPADIATRTSQCSNPGALRIVKISSSSPVPPPNFLSKFGFQDTRTQGKVSDIIPTSESELARQLCTNGQITIAEFNIKRQSLFAFLLKNFALENTDDGEAIDHYEFGAV